VGQVNRAILLLFVTGAVSVQDYYFVHCLFC